MSKRATHTPGPWTANRYSSVVGLPVSAQPDPKQNTIIICGVRGDRETAEANAHLIAASPDMLTELQRLYIKFGYAETGAVIAKATGATS